MTAKVFGSGIRRREDPRLMTGTGNFTDDIVLPGMVHAAAEVSGELEADARVMGDIFASAEYRQAMAPVYVGRALTAAAGRTE